MNAGQLRHRIIVRTATSTPDGMGGTIEGTPVDVPNIPARVEPLQGNEMLQAMQTGMKRPHRFSMRYREGMTGAKVIVYATRTFDVWSVVDPEERHKDLIVLADELNA